MSEAFRRRALAALHGALLGGWWGGWLFAFVRASDRGLWLVDRSLAEHAFGFESQVLPMLASRFGIVGLGNLYLIVFLLLLSGAALGLACSTLGDWLRADPGRKSRSALRDVLRSTGFMVASTAVPLALLAVSFWLSPETVFFVVALLVFGYVLVVPFLAWRRDWLSASPVSLKPVWAWPGWHAFGTVCVIVLASISLKAIEEFAGQYPDWKAAAAAELVSTLVGLVFGIAYCAAWIDRMSITQMWSLRGRLFGWGPLSAMIALEIRVGVLLLWVAAPIFAYTALATFVLPQIYDFLERQGREFPPWLLQYGLLRDIWFFWLALFGPVSIVALGKLYVSLFPESPESSTG